MEIDVLIIGQGICGSFLSWYLQQEGKSYLVIDNNDPAASSRIAAGIINPVTGRRLVTVWMADEVIPNAWKAYQEIGHALDVEVIYQRSIIDFFPNPFMREGFLQKIESGDQYTHAYPEQNHFNHFFNYELGCGEIRPVYTVNLEKLLPAWRKELQNKQCLLEEEFNINDLQTKEDYIIYHDIKARNIIFCDGISSFENPFFRQLPFAPNKGEALVVNIPGLPAHHIYKKSMMIVPMAEPDMFWVGASYIWDFKDAAPTKEFREKTEQVLKEWVKQPFTITEHRSGLRPATLERRPFVGLHPIYRPVGILNGMGTKGYSLAPFFAKQLVRHLCFGENIIPEADLLRFKKILSR
ncbi:MAG: FAD-dependent oxidoreductase [Chitinophagaceae bacterium]